jgi:hypothetical protein
VGPYERDRPCATPKLGKKLSAEGRTKLQKQLERGPSLLPRQPGGCLPYSRITQRYTEERQTLTRSYLNCIGKLDPGLLERRTSHPKIKIKDRQTPRQKKEEKGKQKST